VVVLMRALMGLIKGIHNKAQTDNYGARGNVNPRTGVVGTRNSRY
jgi:hypothetical protein